MRLRNDEVRIETTNLCQAHCTICPREKMTRVKTTMGLEQFIDIADQAKSIGAKTISLFGHGEPLMDKGLEQKIAFCTDNGLETFITTNAGLLTENRSKKLFESGLSHIRFSAHGFAGDYESIHLGLNWEQTMSNIRYFVENRDGCKVSVSVIPMHGETVEQIKSFWEPMVDFLEIWKPHNWCYGKDYRMLKIMQRKKTCGRPDNGPIQIQCDSKVIICCYDFDGRMVVGDAAWDSLEDIIKGEDYNSIRDKHRTGKLNGLICDNCDQLNIEDESPLLYSNRDETRTVGKTSSTKFNMMEV